MFELDFVSQIFLFFKNFGSHSIELNIAFIVYMKALWEGFPLFLQTLWIWWLYNQQIEARDLLREEGIIFNLRVTQAVLAETVLTGMEYAKLIISQ